MTLRGSQSTILMLALLGGGAFAFNPSGVQVQTPFRLAPKNLSPAREQVALQASRRSFVENVAFSTIAVAGGASLLPEHASASGGATAGGVYLLSAKQRYNGRVTKGVKGFLSLGGSLESGDIEDAKNFFKSEEDGNWKDFAAAAYLLANAFRRNSAQAPDTLPSVKKWKAYAAQTEIMAKALKKKDAAGALKAYQDATVALDDYLILVQLPPAKELASI